MHIEQIKLNGITERCKKRNAITLLDECGVIVIGDEQLFSDLKGHLWQKSFVENRNCWHHSIIPFMFGHANYEMATRPYIGLTGKALYIAAHQSEIPQPLNKRYAWLDEKLSTLIIDESLLNNNNQLFPLPFLGVPGWYNKNKDNTFYENTDYFRPKRRKVK